MRKNINLEHDPRMKQWMGAAQAALDTWLEMLDDLGVDEYERETWTYHDRSWARNVVLTFDKHFESGLQRIVFVEDDFAIKIDRKDGSSNLAEWKRWTRLSDKAKAHTVDLYCMTPCGTVMIVEKLKTWDDGSEMAVVQKQRAQIWEECPELKRIPDTKNIENWAFRRDKLVVLDLGGY